MSDTKDRQMFVAQLARELPELSLYSVIELARKLMRQGSSQKRMSEALCNGDIDQDEYGKRTTRIRASVMKLIGPLEGTIPSAEFGGDPRGYTVKLIFKSGRCNCFAGEGWGVPGS